MLFALLYTPCTMLSALCDITSPIKESSVDLTPFQNLSIYIILPLMILPIVLSFIRQSSIPTRPPFRVMRYVYPACPVGRNIVLGLNVFIFLFNRGAFGPSPIKESSVNLTPFHSMLDVGCSMFDVHPKKNLRILRAFAVYPVQFVRPFKRGAKDSLSLKTDTNFG